MLVHWLIPSAEKEFRTFHGESCRLDAGSVPLLQQRSNVFSKLDVPYISGRSTGEPIKRPRLWNAGAVLGSGNYRQKQR